MTEAPKPETFEEIVDWAYRTLPPKIRDLPDFPGIQVADEPPVEVFQGLSQKKKWPRGTELRGPFSGVPRTKRRFNLLYPPELIFVFRGPILRTSKGNLRAEVKQTVWHEVAHWLGHDEEEVKELGLSVPLEELALYATEGEASKTVLLRDTPDEAEVAEEQQPRCVKCYSADVTCRELSKPLTNSASSLSDPIFLRAKICTCKSCGYEWDDEDNT